jgi:hypothetical protein
MSGTKARTTEGGTTSTNQTRHDASTAAERLGRPLKDEQSRDTASEAESEVVVEPTRPPARESGPPTRRPRPRPTLIVKPTIRALPCEARTSWLERCSMSWMSSSAGSAPTSNRA